jgi:hypothetical protein
MWLFQFASVVWFNMTVFRDAEPCSHHVLMMETVKHLWNISHFLPNYMAEHPRRQSSSYSFPLEPEISQESSTILYGLLESTIMPIYCCGVCIMCVCKWCQLNIVGQLQDLRQRKYKEVFRKYKMTLVTVNGEDRLQCVWHAVKC